MLNVSNTELALVEEFAGTQLKLITELFSYLHDKYTPFLLKPEYKECVTKGLEEITQFYKERSENLTRITNMIQKKINEK